MKFTGERMIPEYNEGHEIYLEHITRYIFASQFVKNKVVLDIACGSGYGSSELLKAGAKKVIGIDISKETIDYCKKTYSQKELEFIVGSVENIPLENNSVDVIVSFETIEHVNEKAQIRFLSEAKRILKSGGMFIVSTPNTLVAPKGNPYHIKELNPNEFSEILKNNFSNYGIYYQDDIESSYVFSRETLSNKARLEKGKIEYKKIGKLNPENNLFLIAICSDDLEKLICKEYEVSSNIRPWLKYQQYEGRIQQKDQELSNLNQTLQQKDKKKDQQINNLNQAVQQKDQQISNLNQSLQQKDQQISNLNQLIQQKEQELYDIRTSLRWKIPNYLYKQYRKRIKKFIPKFVFQNKDRLVISLRRFGILIEKSMFYVKNIKKVVVENGPKITIGIASYNHSKYLKKCIESALNQNYKKFNIVIVDDNSSDPKNKKILKQYKNNSKVEIIYKSRNEGISASLNSQVINATGDWVAFLDCDDYLPKNALSEMAKYIKSHPEKKLVCSNRIEIDKNDNFLRKVWFGSRFKNPNIFEELLKGMVSSHLKLIHKDAFRKVGLFDLRFNGTHDYDMYLRVAFYMPKAFGFVNKYLYCHRIHFGQNTKIDNEKHKKNVEIILKEARFRQCIYGGAYKPLISIIILSFGRGVRTYKTVRAILRCGKNIHKEIIIWDNHSMDKKTLNILRELNKLDNINVIFCQKNLRCSGGRREAVKQAKGKFMLFLDNDIEITLGTIEELLIRLHESPEHVGACCRVAFPDRTLQYNGGALNYNGKFVRFSLIDSGKRTDDLASMRKRECGWIPGGATMFRREIFNIIEHDAKYINAFEDNDFSLKITEKLKKKVVNCPTSNVVHYHINFEALKDHGAKVYRIERYKREAFIASWLHFYKKWAFIINDDFIFDIAELKDKSDDEVLEYAKKNCEK